jgi:hypothetical protein
MRIYVPSPEVNVNPDVPMIRVSTADNVCASDAYTISVPSKDNRYVMALTWTLTDDDCDLLLEELAAARGKRLMAQEKAYETLREKFAGPFGNDRTDPDNDFPEFPVPVDAPEDGE